MSVRNFAYSDMATLRLTNVPIHHFENMATQYLSEERHNDIEVEVNYKVIFTSPATK